MTLQERLKSARKEYLAHPSRAALRRYLITKAKLGKFDSRMCRYYGVPVPTNPRVQQAIVRGYAAGLVPTATTNGGHAPGSYHKLGLAVDLGLIESQIGTKYGRDKLVTHQRQELWRFRHGKINSVAELLGPENGWVVLRGAETDLAEGSPLENAHDNHFHEGFFR
jgi:hypothetical protein